jgi:hypothetical protein
MMSREEREGGEGKFSFARFSAFARKGFRI